MKVSIAISILSVLIILVSIYFIVDQTGNVPDYLWGIIIGAYIANIIITISGYIQKKKGGKNEPE